MKPGSLCQLVGRPVFKFGYVLGPSRSPGKTRVRLFSASARSWSNPFVIADEHVKPLPPRAERSATQRLTVKNAALSVVLDPLRGHL